MEVWFVSIVRPRKFSENPFRLQSRRREDYDKGAASINRVRLFWSDAAQVGTVSFQ